MANYGFDMSQGYNNFVPNQEQEDPLKRILQGKKPALDKSEGLEKFTAPGAAEEMIAQTDAGMSPKGKMDDVTKASLITGGITAGAALLQGLAAALLGKDEEKEVRGRTAIPSGSVSGVGRSATPGYNLSRNDLPYDRQSLALALLGKSGGY